MHILLIHQAFAAINEAGGTRHFEFARFLVAQGHKVTVIASPVSYLSGASSQTKNEQIDGVTIYRAYTYQALHRSFFHRIFSFISFMVSSFIIGYRVKDVDIVWGTSPPIFQGITALAIARIKKAKFLFEVRDLWPDFAIAVGILTNSLLISASRWLERFLYKNADQMIVNSPAYVQHVIDRGAKHVTLIPNGADPAMFDPLANGDAFKSLHTLTDKFVVMYAGAHGISNDLQVVIDAACMLLNEPRIQIVFVGDGKERQNLITYAKKTRATNVHFIPSVAKTNMSNVLAAADACIAILKPIEEYKTTYPNKVFDYMAAGKPVLLAIDGVIRQVVEDAKCGVFVEPGNPNALATGIMTLYSDPFIAKKIGANGPEYLKNHFSRESIARQLESVLLKL